MSRDQNIANTEDAELIALRALAFLAETGALPHFCAISGIAEVDLRANAGQPELLGAVLDYALDDEQRLNAFAACADLPPESVVAARRLLPGG